MTDPAPDDPIPAPPTTVAPTKQEFVVAASAVLWRLRDAEANEGRATSALATQEHAASQAMFGRPGPLPEPLRSALASAYLARRDAEYACKAANRARCELADPASLARYEAAPWTPGSSLDEMVAALGDVLGAPIDKREASVIAQDTAPPRAVRWERLAGERCTFLAVAYLSERGVTVFCVAKRDDESLASGDMIVCVADGFVSYALRSGGGLPPPLVSARERPAAGTGVWVTTPRIALDVVRDLLAYALEVPTP